MEDYSNFIHEELFLIDQQKTKQVVSQKITYKLAVITGAISEEEKSLLNKILSALKLESTEILYANKFENNRSVNWIIFGNKYSIENQTIEYYKPITIKNSMIILAKPLSVLSQSEQDKHKLWTVLKSVFSV